MPCAEVNTTRCIRARLSARIARWNHSGRRLNAIWPLENGTSLMAPLLWSGGGGTKPFSKRSCPNSRTRDIRGRIADQVNRLLVVSEPWGQTFPPQIFQVLLDGPCKGSPARLPIGTEIGKKGRLSWIPGASLVKRGVTGCFYRLSHGVMAEEASFGKVVSYQWLKAFTGCIRPPESHMSHL
jgi:hypothetical protein